MYQRSPTFVMSLDKAWPLLGGPLYSEGSPPTDVADELFMSMPQPLQENGMAQRQVNAILEQQKATIEGLNKAGFRTCKGMREAGFAVALKVKGGGHYFGECGNVIGTVVSYRR